MTKGLCFSCDENYVVGHNCRANKQLIMVELLEDVGFMEWKGHEIVQEVTESPQRGDELMTISLQASTGAIVYQATRVTRYHEKRPLQVLIDTGSTHNFTNQEVAKKLGCKASAIAEQYVSVANGRQVQTA